MKLEPSYMDEILNLLEKNRESSKLEIKRELLEKAFSNLRKFEEIKVPYYNKYTHANGIFSQLLGRIPIPKMVRARQLFDSTCIRDIEKEVAAVLQRQGTLDSVKKGQNIAVAVGSRGINNLDRIVKAVVEGLKAAGANPFIIPAMGSHGGATSQGQSEILAGFNITEETVKCPIHCSMDVERLGTTETGITVYADSLAVKADGIVIINRVKPHTCFRGKYESGLLKMLAIGLGKQKGAETCHQYGFENMEKNIKDVARYILKKSNIIFAVGILENAYDETKSITAIPGGLIFEEEPSLLETAKKSMPSILIDEVDILIVDKIGKDISGDGMDPNITGTFPVPNMSGGIKKKKTVVLDITNDTHGNSSGLGMADFSTMRAFEKIVFDKTYPTVLTCNETAGFKIPVIMPNDKLAICAAIKTCTNIDINKPRIVRIKNTLKLDEIMISESLTDTMGLVPGLRLISEPENMLFDENDNLF